MMIGALKKPDKASERSIKAINNILKTAIEQIELNHIDSEPNIEELECESRDEFSPFTENHGGYKVTGFIYYFHDGECIANKRLQEELAKCYKSGVEAFIYDHKEELKKLGIKDDDVNYQTLEDKDFNLAEKLDEYIYNDEQFSMMLSVRLYYQGYDPDLKVHTLLIDSCINYHRNSISWMSDYKTHDHKEKYITFKTVKELRKQLKPAINGVMNLFE